MDDTVFQDCLSEIIIEVIVEGNTDAVGIFKIIVFV